MDQRLTLIAEMVKPCNTIADIGTDHGFLVCALVAQGKARRGIAADINPLPLEKARREIARQGLCGSIETVLTDGLQGITLEADDGVVIAGMGGELIARILEDWWQCVAQRHDYYLQPMTKPEKLREYLYENGFHIMEEHCCIAAGRPYSVLHVRSGGEPRHPTPVERYLGQIDPQESEAAKGYCHKLLERLHKRLRGIVGDNEHAGEARQLQEVMKEISRRLEHEGSRDI